MRNFAKIEIPNMGTWFITVTDFKTYTWYRLSHYRDGHRCSPSEQHETLESCFRSLSQQIKECVLKDAHIEINPLLLF